MGTERRWGEREIKRGGRILALLISSISDIWMDREVIQKHLGDQPCNPFNREPLTLAEIETENSLPEVQISKNKLLKEIEDWKLSLKITP